MDNNDDFGKILALLGGLGAIIMSLANAGQAIKDFSENLKDEK